MRSSYWSVGIALLLFTLVANAAPPAPGLPGMQSQRIEESVFGGHAYVYQAGKEHARSVLLVHGLGSSP